MAQLTYHITTHQICKQTVTDNFLEIDLLNTAHYVILQYKQELLIPPYYKLNDHAKYDILHCTNKANSHRGYNLATSLLV